MALTVVMGWCLEGLSCQIVKEDFCNTDTCVHTIGRGEHRGSECSGSQ